MGSGEDMDFCFRFHKRFGKPIRFVEQALIFHKHRSSDAALWKQARWHGAGYALVSQRHPDIINWPVWKTPMIHLSIGMLNAGKPLVWLLRVAHLITLERAEFENYHRRWFRQFWAGFLEERRKSLK